MFYGGYYGLFVIRPYLIEKVLRRRLCLTMSFVCLSIGVVLDVSLVLVGTNG